MTDTPELTAILYEKACDPLFKPLLENRSFCQLPVGGKPLIQYWCEHLKLIGIHELHILVRSFPEKVRIFVGAGERWGIKNTVISLPLRSNLQATLKQARALMNAEVFIADIAQLPVKIIPRHEQFASILQPQSIDAARLETEFSTPALIKLEALSEFLNASRPLEFLAYPEPMKRINTPKDLWQMNISNESKQGCEVVSLTGRLDAMFVQDGRQQIMLIADQPGKAMIIDMSGVDFIDSSGLGFVVSVFKHVRQKNAELVLVGLTPQARSLFELTRMNQILTILPDEQAALVQFAG